MKKLLALGRQEFSEVIENGCIYVDKTEIIHSLLTTGKYYFLSRPRRFGKSLLCNTLKELFLGKKELFKGLWIYDKWNWEQKFPVIKISFSNIDHNKLGLEKAIEIELNRIAKNYGLQLNSQSNAMLFKELIESLSDKEKVAIIIDEYDKPIIDYMTDIEKAKTNREILKNFYSVIKDSDKYLKFFFITGVSKFSKVSIFSDLNNPEDITIIDDYATIVGWTIEEIQLYFRDYLAEVETKFRNIFPDIISEIKNHYNGYSWDGKTKVCNPVSIMNFLKAKRFDNFWFATGTPTFLTDIIKEKRYTPFRLQDEFQTSSEILDKYDFRNLQLTSLLFQTGYLTIKKIDIRTGRIKLDYPNNEVEESFSKHILAELTSGYLDRTQSLLYKISDSFCENNLDTFITSVNVLFKNIPYQIIEDKESYFHSLFYLLMKLIGFQIESEILTIDGRIDAVVKTDNHIFVIEFKVNQTAKNAIQQIRNKNYPEKYANDKLPIVLIGINFDTTNRKIDDWLVEKL